MTDARNDHQPEFTTSAWSLDGEATLHATGPDPRSALEAGLQGTLTLALGSTLTPGAAGRSVPVRGEGDDLAALFADILDDLLEQIAEYGAGLHDVAVDGVLRKDGGGYVAWGYAAGTLEPAAAIAPPRLSAPPAVRQDGQHVIIRALFRRS